MTQLTFIRLNAKQEWSSVFRSKAPLILYFILLVMSILATFTGWQYVRGFNERQDHARHEVHDHWMKQPDRHPHRVAHYGYLVFREKSPLSFFDFGLDSYVGNSVFLEAHRQNTVNMSEAGFSNGMLRFGELSMALVMQLLVPLFIIFTGFQTVAGLKQNGVLKILLCQRASYFEILAGKTLGLAAVTSVLFLPLLLLSLLLGISTLPTSGRPDLPVRIGLLLVSYGLYFLILSGVVVAVSAVSKNAKSALMLLVMIWMLLFIVLPKSAQTLGNSLYEAPDKITFEQDLEEDISKEGDTHNPNDPHFTQLKINTLKKYGVDSVHKLPVNYGALVMQEGETISSRIFTTHYNRLIRTYKAQNSVSELLGFLDPYLALRNASMVLCGVDFETFTEFQRQTEKYRFEKAQTLNDIHLTEIKYQNDRNQKVSQETWQKQPEFRFEPVGIGESLRNSASGFASLLGWLLGGGLLLRYISSKRQFMV
jgi:ABC-2 type transport system permease protein